MRKTSTLFALMLAFLIQQAFAQQRTISGKVISKEDTKGIPGVSVVEVGTTNGTTTDGDGIYKLAVSATAKQIKFSGLGVKEQTLDIGTSDVMDVTMEADVQKLGEVVVTALGIKREEKSLGYATQSVSGAEITTAKETNFINSLQGRVAGVSISGSSNIGGSSRILLRGVRSISYENQPYFVVDGIPINNGNYTTLDQRRGALGIDYGNAAQDINPDDIQDITILKGSSATALYGSQGANGAIIINSKKGTPRIKGEGKLPIGVHLSTGMTWTKVAVLPEYQNRYGGGAASTDPAQPGKTISEFVPSDMFPEVDAFGNPVNNRVIFEYDGSWGPEMLGQPVYQWNAYYPSLTGTYGKKTPWSAHPDNIKDYFETGVSTNNSVAVDGGNENATYRLGYTNLHSTGTFPNSKINRNVISFNGSNKFTEKLSSSITAYYIGAQGRARPRTGYSNLASNFTQWWQRQLDMKELKDYKNPDGTQRTWNMNAEDDLTPLYWDNPYWEAYENYETDQRNRLIGAVRLSYELVKGITIQGAAKTDYYREGRQERVAKGGSAISKYSEENIIFNENNYELIVTGTKSLSDNFDVTAFVGVNRQNNKIVDDLFATQGGLNAPNFYNLTNSVSTVLVTPRTDRFRRNSAFASASLGYKRFLYLDITARNDWSSTLPEGNNSNLYPSVTGSFVFSELTNLNWLSYGKFRAGWSSTAIDPPPYRATETRPTVTDNFAGYATAIIPVSANNTTLKPETTTSMELGVELNFFHNRVALDFTWYNAKSKDVIMPVQQSSTTGFNSKIYNAAELSNKGIELELKASILKSESFEWGIGGNYAKNKNTVEKLFTDENGKETESLLIQNAPFAVTFQARPGESYGQIVGYDYAYDSQGRHIIDPGTHSYARTATVVPLGSVLPDFTGGAFTWVEFKGIRLSALVDFQKGGHLFSLTNTWGKYSGTLAETAEGDIRNTGIVLEGVLQDSTAEDGTPLSIEGIANTDTLAAVDHFFLDGGYVIGAADVYDASFIKLREITLTYTFPEKMFKNSFIGGISFSLVGRNLAILHKNVPNIDPESAVSSNNVQGLEGGQLPSVRTYGARLNITF